MAPLANLSGRYHQIVIVWHGLIWSNSFFKRFIAAAKRQHNGLKLQWTTHTHVVISVTRFLDYLFNIWPFTTMEMCPKRVTNFSKHVQNFAEFVNKPSGNGQILLTFSQSGEISLNLVTLVVMKNGGEASTLVWNQYFSANLSASHIQSTEYRICCWYYWIF